MNASHVVNRHQENLLDEALEETFPASDPISPAVGLVAASKDPVDSMREKSQAKALTLGSLDKRGGITLDASAVWDPRYGLFWIRINDSPQFAAVAMLATAPLPLKHLDQRESSSGSSLGAALHDRLQYEVSDAIRRGGQQVATGIMLITHQEMKSL